MTETEACSACGAPVARRQEYCLECGARIGAPVRKAPYWAWPTAAAAIVAAGGAAIAVAAGGSGSGPQAIVALTPLRPVAAPAPTGAGDAQSILSWPQRDGHTVVVGLVPSATGRREATALARRAIAAGLPEVGILDSGRYASLHPGYSVVFSGIYATREEALLALPKAARSFRSAYAQEIVR